MDLGYARGFALQPDTLPVTLIKQVKPAERSWRMQQALMAYEAAEQAADNLVKKDKQSNLFGLAMFIRHRFDNVGYGAHLQDLTSLLSAANLKLRQDPECFTRVKVGNGREAVACNMKPGEYLLLQAAETLVLWSGLKLADAGKLSELPDVAPNERDVLERIYICLLRLSGNMASTVRNAEGELSEAVRSPTVSLIPIGNGESAPADLVMATQLDDFKLHPKQLAWLLNELQYDASRLRAVKERHGLSVKAMIRATDAMMVLTSDPEAMPQHPDVDLTAAAARAAAVGPGAAASSTAAGSTNSTNSANSSTSSAAGSGSGKFFLPPAGASNDEVVLQLLRGQSVSKLKELLTTYDVSYKHCVEKEDIVQLALQSYRNGDAPAAATPPAAAVISGRPNPCDLSRWRQMALFLRAEALETAHGRTPTVVATFQAAVAASKANDDELYGCLSAWNAVRVIMDGPAHWRVGEVLELLDYAAACEVKLKGWNGYLMIQPRIMILKKPLRDTIKETVAAARRLSFKKVSGSFRYSDIRSAKVRDLIQPGDEDYEIPVDPRVASMQRGCETAELAGKQCAGCNKLFHAVMVCSGCKSVQYCSRDCQKTHWKEQHKRDCERMKAEKAGRGR